MRKMMLSDVFEESTSVRLRARAGSSSQARTSADSEIVSDLHGLTGDRRRVCRRLVVQGCASPYLHVFNGRLVAVEPTLLEEKPLGEDARQRLRAPQYGDKGNEIQKDRDEKQDARGSYSRFLCTQPMDRWLGSVRHAVELSPGSESRHLGCSLVCRA